ncbi:hypothetical protein B4U80_12315, partial [Leptotrombidium deliense]
HLAASYRKNEVIRAINQKVPNLDINAKGPKMLTPLQMAVKYMYRHFSTIELLVHLNADCNVFDGDGNSVLHIAVQGFNDCFYGNKKFICGQKGNESKVFKKKREYLSAIQQTNCAYLVVLNNLIERGKANIYARNNKNERLLLARFDFS